MKTTLLTSLLLAIFLFSCTTYSVKKVTQKNFEPEGKDGIFYYLPKVEYEVVIEYEETVIKKSDFVDSAGDAKKFMDTIKKGIDGIIPDIYLEDTSYFVVKNVTLNPIVTPDTTQLYYISLLRKGHPFLKKTFTAALTNDGLITGMTMESEDNTLGFGVSMVETAASIYGSFMGFGKSADAAASAHGGGTGTKKPHQLIIERIAQLRKEMGELLSGNYFEGDYADKPVEFVYQKLKEEEEALWKLLAGTKKVTVKTLTKRYVPSSVDTTINAEEIGNLKISLKGVQDSTILNTIVKEKNKLGSNKKMGLHYRMPVTAEISIKLLPKTTVSNKGDNPPAAGSTTKATTTTANTNEKQIHCKYYLIPQLGPTTYLPARIGLTKNKLEFAIDPATGALLSFSANSEGASLETIAKLNDAITGTVSGAVDKRDADKEKEKNKVKEEQENTINYLENQIKLKQLQLQLDSLNNNLR